MDLIETFVRSPVKVSVGVLLIVMFGLIAIVKLPRQLTPDVEIPTITIETRWPGASPQEVEREIVQEQEEQLKSVEGVQKMTSQSFESMANIILEFNVGIDMEAALLRVNTRLQQVREYPEDADEPVLTTTNLSNNPIAWFILTPRAPTPEGSPSSPPSIRRSLRWSRQRPRPTTRRCGCFASARRCRSTLSMPNSRSCSRPTSTCPSCGGLPKT
jgi:HAE1 family hydrophobic/amphiphilic exporter-1